MRQWSATNFGCEILHSLNFAPQSDLIYKKFIIPLIIGKSSLMRRLKVSALQILYWMYINQISK